MTFRVLLAAPIALLLTAGVSHAKMPAFKATCPTSISVEGKNNGNVRINGKKAEIITDKKNYREAKGAGVVVSIAYNDAGGDLIVSYTGKGGANGICQVVSQAGQSAAPAAAATPSRDEQACLQAVSIETNNGDVALVSTTESEANNTVIIGVGPNRAQWRCLVKDGKVAEVMSLTNEGTN